MHKLHIKTVLGFYDAIYYLSLDAWFVQDLMILFERGTNIIISEYSDMIRKKLYDRFENHIVIMFSRKFLS